MRDPVFHNGDTVRVLSWKELDGRMNPDNIQTSTTYYGIGADDYDRANESMEHTVIENVVTSVRLTFMSGYYWPVEAVMHADEYEQTFGGPLDLPEPDAVDLSAWLSTLER